MRWRSIRPVHGWPELVQEVLIVVVGVLIALGAQQMLDDWHWRGEIREFRAAMDNELGYDLGAYQDRLKRSPCIKRRVDQLEQWVAEIKKGRRLRLVTPISRPITLNPRQNVWESRTPEASSHLGLENRLAYASLYDSVALYSSQRDEERRVWNELADFEGADALDDRDVMRLRGLLQRAREMDRLANLNFATFQQRVNRLNIRPRSEADDPSRSSGLCLSLRWQPA